MVDGCRVHNLSHESVARRWDTAGALDEPCSTCGCCLGPSLLGSDFCRRCESLTSEQIRQLENGVAAQGVLI